MTPATLNALRVLVVGGLNVDYQISAEREPVDDACSLADRFAIASGGHAGNCAVALSRLGARVWIGGAVGNDEAGELVERELAAAAVDTSHLVRLRGQQTGRVVIPAFSTRRYMLMFRGANDADADALGVDTYPLADFDAVVVCDPSQSAFEALLRRCRTFDRGRLLLSPGGLHPARALAAESCPGVKSVVLNEVEFKAAFGSAAARRTLASLLTQGVEVVRTEGVRGATVLAESSETSASGRPVDCVDATGAGDAFVAGWVVGSQFFAQRSQRLRFANAVAGLSTRGYGARAGLPSLDEVMLHVRDRSEARAVQ